MSGEDEKQERTDNESRRSFMKKSALASTGVALGVGATDTAAATDAAQQIPGQALVFGYEYNPELSFAVINRLQQGTVDSVLGREVDDDPIVSDTADYNGYVIRYQPEQDAGEYGFAFIREGTLRIGETFRFGTDATFFNSQVNLLTAGLRSGGGN